MQKLDKARRRKILWTVAFIALNVVVIAITAVNEFGNSANAAELSEVTINGWWLLPAVLVFAIGTFANVLKYVVMMYRSFGTKERPRARKIWQTAWRVVMLGKYYDNVTPASIGGQPFQIYYMHKNSGLKSGHATSLPIFGMIAGQIGFLIVAVICFLAGDIMGKSPALATLAWIGLLFYAFWPVMIAGISFFPKQTTKFLQFCTRVLAKLKIVKKRETALRNIEKEVKEYADSVKMILKTHGLFTATILLAVVYHVAMSAIPYFVLTAFGGDVGFFECFVTTLAVTSAVYFVPTPGNSGAAEGTFYMVFSALSTGYVFWAMLLWRFFSYYIYIIMGPVTYFQMHLEKKRGGLTDAKKSV